MNKPALQYVNNCLINNDLMEFELVELANVLG